MESVLRKSAAKAGDFHVSPHSTSLRYSGSARNELTEQLSTPSVLHITCRDVGAASRQYQRYRKDGGGGKLCQDS